MITGEQIRAAMAMLRWSRRVLGEKSGVNLRTVQRIVECNGIPNSNAQYVNAIEKALLSDGRIVFQGEDGVFVKPKAKNPNNEN